MAEDDYSPGGKATFNAGVASTLTIRTLMDRLHFCRNPYGTNIIEGYGQPNYLTFLETLNSLWAEVLPKANKEEVPKIDSLKRLCDYSINKHKPYTFDKHGNSIPNADNINKLVCFMNKFERELRQCIERAGLSNPNRDDDFDQL